MPRVNVVKKARKARPHAGIEVGDQYYWWKFRYGGTCYSKTFPRPSQLTQSKWSEVYAAQEAIEDATDIDGLLQAIDDAISTLEDTASEYEEAAEAFGGEGPNQERADHLNELVSELEEVKSEIEDWQSEQDSDLLDRYVEASGNTVKDGLIFDEGGEFVAKYDDDMAKAYLEAADAESAEAKFDVWKQDAESLDWDSPA